MNQFVVTHELRQVDVRRETFMGRTFRVIPAVLVRSQVLHNNLGVTLLPAESITDEWAELWNGIPVLVGPHPSQQGQPISGRSPELWEERGAGWIFRARAEQESGEVRRLVAEVWIDESRAEVVAGLREVLEHVEAGHPVELSTGFAAQVVQQQGTFQGEAFEAVMRPAGADHLVISTEMTGACAVTDGCGLGVNKKKETASMEQPKAGWRTALDKATDVILGRRAKQRTDFEENFARNVARELEVINAVTPSDQERANMIRGALQNKFGGSDREVVLTDVYSDEKQVVFWLHTAMGPQPPGPEFFRVSFTEEDGGAFNFGEPERVRRMTSYEPAAQNATAHNSKSGTPCGCQEETSMQESEKKELVTELTTAFQAALKPVQDAVANIGQVAKDAAEAAANAVKSTLEASINEIKTDLNALKTTVNAERDAERQALVQTLSSNQRTPFTAAELEAKPLDELRKIATMAKVDVTSFAARGGPRVENSEPDAAFAPITPYFEKKEQATNSNGKQEAK